MRRMAKNQPADKKPEPTVEDLQKELQTKRNDLIEARRSNASGELANPKIINSYRKEVARLLTEINARKESE
ncbi:50S ribosomal protein L29 [Candidatus Saccharibacteria bacterium]|nr:50S ribosomal protein L29 [Candidatus Saccharibacteria bacterium]